MIHPQIRVSKELKGKEHHFSNWHFQITVKLNIDFGRKLMNMTKPFTKTFIGCLLVYDIYENGIRHLFTPKENLPVGLGPILWQEVSGWSPIFAFVGAVLGWLSLYFLGAFFIKISWNNFIVDVFKIRNIFYDEALRWGKK